MSKVELCFISDTHGAEKDVKIRPCDIIVHSGDFSNSSQRGHVSLGSLIRFLKWLESQPAPEKVLIAGNHDFICEKNPDLIKLMVKEFAPSVAYLNDTGFRSKSGVFFWGSPVTPEFCNWAFNRVRGQDIKRHWDKIPDGTNVLVTHGPPFEIHDFSQVGNEHCGCKDLLEAVNRVKPDIHCFGHIHGHWGARRVGPTYHINASICNEDYKPTRPPIYFAATTEEVGGRLRFKV